MALMQSEDASILTAHNLEGSPQKILLVGLVGQRNLVLLLFGSLGKSGGVAHFSVCRIMGLMIGQGLCEKNYINRCKQLTFERHCLQVLPLHTVSGFVLDQVRPTLLGVVRNKLDAFLVHGHVLSHRVETGSETFLVVRLANVSKLVDALVENLGAEGRVFKQTLAHRLLRVRGQTLVATKSRGDRIEGLDFGHLLRGYLLVELQFWVASMTKSVVISVLKLFQEGSGWFWRLNNNL